MPKALPLEGRALTESTVRNMLTAIQAPLYDVGVLSERGMLPGLNGILAAAVPDWLSLLKHRNRLAHLYPPIGKHLNEAQMSGSRAGLRKLGGAAEDWTTGRCPQSVQWQPV